MIKYPKISEAIKKAHAAGKMDTSFGGNKGWSKGKTKDTDIRIKNRVVEKSSLFIKEEEILRENSVHSRKIIRRYLSYNNIKINNCGHVLWNGEILTKDLHHKNGIQSDNRKDNLEWLCPNCHSLTENYKFKNGNKRNKMPT